MNQNAIFQYLTVDKVIKKSKEKGADISKKDENMAKFLPLISPAMASISTVISIDNIQKKIPPASPAARNIIRSTENNHLSDISLIGQELTANQVSTLRPQLSALVQQRLGVDLQNPPTAGNANNVTNENLIVLMVKLLQEAGVIAPPSNDPTTGDNTDAGSGVDGADQQSSHRSANADTGNNETVLSEKLDQITEMISELDKKVSNNTAKLKKLPIPPNPKNTSATKKK